MEFTPEYIKKLIDEAGRRAIQSLSVGPSGFQVSFYPNAGDATEPTKSTVAVQGGPLGLGVIDEWSPETMTFPGPGGK